MSTTEKTGPWGAGDSLEAELKNRTGGDTDGSVDAKTGSVGDDPRAAMAEMLGSMFGNGRDGKVQVPVDEHVAILQATAARFAAPLAFKVGDVVTPAKHSPLRGAGLPHVIIEVLPAPFDTKLSPAIDLRQDVGGTDLGQLLDIRVISLRTGSIGAFLVESAWFEPWTPPAAKAEPAA